MISEWCGLRLPQYHGTSAGWPTINEFSFRHKAQFYCLGRSDELFEQDCDGGEEYEASIVGEELVISGGDPAELF